MAVLTIRTDTSTVNDKRQARACRAKGAAVTNQKRLNRATSTTFARGTIPQYLPRPAPPPEVDEPDYLFCLDRLTADVGPRALYAVSQSSISPPAASSALPVSVPARIAGPLPPTHALALFAPSSSNVSLFAVHEDILAAHCTNLPALAHPENIPANHLPVQTLCFPHPPSYGPLSQYIYSHRQDVLFNALCPGAQMFSRQPHLSRSDPVELDEVDMQRVAKMIHATHSRQSIFQSLQYIHGLWANIHALGVHEDGIWEVVDVAWRLHRAALFL